MGSFTLPEGRRILRETSREGRVESAVVAAIVTYLYGTLRAQGYPRFARRSSNFRPQYLGEEVRCRPRDQGFRNPKNLVCVPVSSINPAGKLMNKVLAGHPHLPIACTAPAMTGRRWLEIPHTSSSRTAPDADTTRQQCLGNMPHAKALDIHTHTPTPRQRSLCPVSVSCSSSCLVAPSGQSFFQNATRDTKHTRGLLHDTDERVSKLAVVSSSHPFPTSGTHIHTHTRVSCSCPICPAGGCGGPDHTRWWTPGERAERQKKKEVCPTRGSS